MAPLPVRTGTATLSVTVITLNEEQNLPRCLASIADLADQIVVVDSGSSDATREIAEAAGAVVHIRPFTGYGAQKQFALEQATGDWILCLDADEWLDDRAREAVRSLLRAPIQEEVGGFRLQRRCYYLGRWIGHGGWSQRKLRLVRHGRARWGDASLHESLCLTGGKAGTLPGSILHFPYRGLAHQLEKVDRYTDMAADLDGSASPFRIWFGIVLEPPLAFLHKYFIQLGFLDRMPGFVAAVMGAIYVFLRYTKIWQKRRQPADRPPFSAPMSWRKRAESWIRRATGPLASRIPIPLPSGIGAGLRIRGALSYCKLLREDTDEERFLKRLELGGKVIVDAGGFLGIYALFFAVSAGRRGKVYVFEPNPMLFDLILRNIVQNKADNVQAFNCALADVNGPASLRVPPHHLGGASLHDFGQRRGPVNRVPVKTRRLDDFLRERDLDPPDFIKIDVEGLELQVLLGMKGLLQARTPELFIELHGGEERQELYELLVGYGYRIYHVEHGGYIGEADRKWMSEGHVYCHGPDARHVPGR